MEGLAHGHAAQLHPTEGRCLYPGANTLLEVERSIREGHLATLHLGSPWHVGGLCGPQFSHLYQLWFLRLMFVGQKVWGSARVGSVGKKEDQKTLLGWLQSHSPRYSQCPPGRSHLWSPSSVSLPEGFLWLQECGLEVLRPSPTEGGTGE